MPMTSLDQTSFPAPVDQQISLQKFIVFFETISPETCKNLSSVYTADAYFKDPFNEIRGLTEIEKIFRHMFVQLDVEAFKITTSVLQDDTAFICWDFLFRMKRDKSTQQCIRGASHIHFAADGRVDFHRDYWDAAEELYEKLPVLGSFMRFLKSRARK